jgi:peptidoglycan-associated lipoprotein
MSFALSPRHCAIIALLPLVAACTTKPTQTAATTPPPTVTQPVQHVQSGILPGSAKDFEVNVGDTVHFDYNQSNVRDDDKAMLQRQAAWLNKYPAVQVTIEGHCDERGTRSYNLALGAKRAEAVKEYLSSVGVSSSRMTTISYGKERPVCTQSDETCWAENRRSVTTIAKGAAVTSGAAS